LERVKKALLFLLTLFLFMFSLTGCTGKEAASPDKSAPNKTVTITVAAAASLQDAANKLQEIYSTQHPEVKVIYNFASSGTLMQQIKAGAPIDLFISAGKSQVDELSNAGLLINSSQQDLLGNTLLLIAPKNSTLTNFEGLKNTNIKMLSIGNPETVPAGKYAQETLTNLKLWDELQSKMVLAKDVRQVLTYVERGDVDAGLVYKSDAISNQAIKIVAKAPADSHKAIVYPLAIIKSSSHQKEVQAFIDFLNSPEAAKVFVKYGFKTIAN